MLGDLGKGIELDNIYCESNIVFLNKLEDKSVDLVVTSPPYDNLRKYKGYSFDFEKDFKPVVQELYRVMKEGGVVCWVVGDAVINGGRSMSSFKQALYFGECGFKLYEHLIYQKTGSAPPHKNRYSNNFEHMFVFSKGKPKTVNLIEDKPNKWAGTSSFGTSSLRGKDDELVKKGKRVVKEMGRRNTIWKVVNNYGFSTKDKEVHKHPAIFPESLARDLIVSYSDKGDVVLDIYSGSGTTCKMAMLEDRRYLGCEISEDYYLLSLDRLNKYKNNE